MQTAKVKLILCSNRPFPSSKHPHFQNEANWETFLVKMSFISMRLKNHFHINGYELSLALKQRLGSLALKQRLGETREKSFLS